MSQRPSALSSAVCLTACLIAASAAAPAATAQQQPVRVGGEIKEPKKIKDVKPVYPEEARSAGVQGIVIIEEIIGTDGAVTEAKVLRPVQMLDQAALAAVMQWRYTPTLLNGEPVAVVMVVTVTFSLSQTSTLTSADADLKAKPESSVLTSANPNVAGGLEVPVRIGGEIKEPTKIKDVKPVYPEAARSAGVQGVVILEIVVGTDGHVVSAKVIRSVPGLDEAAVDAAREWQYMPTQLNGGPVPVVLTATVRFLLGQP